ncbi:uncharacterized protein LOC135469713 [Liolophura sinensis]|uniref:uncharacterized protein LOC135469713 n=1 Tax=Liolophura sinensis TaxID=3198878 RepID=UPI003158095E
MSTSTELQLSLEEFQVPFRASHLQQNCENSQEMMISKHNTDNHHQASFEVYDHPLAASYQHQKPDRVMSSTQINNNNDQTASGSFPVSYSKQNGGVAIINDTSTPQPDGTQVIQTSQYQSPSAGRYESDRPLTKRYQQILKILSVVAAIVFFPIGIPAVYYAFKTEKEFNAGILRGDISLLKNTASGQRKFIIFSYLLFVMVVILSFTVQSGLNGMIQIGMDIEFYLVNCLFSYC